MKNLFRYIAVLLIASTATGQSAELLYKKGDSLSAAKEYRNAALAYAAGIRGEGNSASLNRYWTLASNWSLGRETDSAFHYLKIIARSAKLNRVVATGIGNDLDFLPLQKDKRWKDILTKIQFQAEKNGYRQEEFIYGRKDGVALILLQIKPKLKSNGRGIVYVVSGNWNSFYNGIEIATGHLEQYLKKGYTIFAVVHGSQPRFSAPDAVNDLKRAVRYIRYNAAKFGIDPGHIGITGYSSGGHLSLMIATADETMNPLATDPVDRVSSRIQAAAVLFPPTDFLNWGKQGVSLVNAKEILKRNKLWGSANYTIWNENYRLYEEVTDTATRNKIARENSPLNLVTADDPPVFIIHGDADATVPLQQSQSIIDRYREAGVANRLVIKPGGKHNADDMKPEWLDFVNWFDKYLR